jgi:hypothetical protein
MTFPRPESVLRIVQQNVGNLPSNAKASKSRQFTSEGAFLWVVLEFCG